MHKTGDPRPWAKTDREEIAAYVAALASDLRELARRSDLPTLAYLLDMARLEAESAACKKTGDSDPVFGRS